MMLSMLEHSLLFLPLALGIYISYGVLRIPDLTTDGSFVLGAALFAISINAGVDPILATLFATAGGVFAGITVSLLQTKLHLNPLIAGILQVFILNTLTLKIMGRPNLSLFDTPSIFSSHSKIAILSFLGVIFIAACSTFLASRCGLMLHAFGNNPTLLNLSGKNADNYRMLGLSLSNGLVGCSGALTAQASGYADVGMGSGVVLIALATVIVGKELYRFLLAGFAKNSFTQLIRLLCCLIGIVIYFFTVNILISLGLDPIYLRLMIGLCLIGFLGATKVKNFTPAAHV